MSRKWMTVMVLAVSGAAPMAALAECPQWDASGDITLRQANGARPFFNLQQSGSELHGSATYTITTPECSERATCEPTRGEVTGSIKGDSFEVTARWENGSVGVYRGGVDSNGGMEGATYDRSHPESASSWYSERPLNCSTSMQAPAAPSPPPLTGTPARMCPESQCLQCVGPVVGSGPCAKCGPIPNCEPAITNQRRSSDVLVPEPSTGPSPFEPPPAIESVPKPPSGFNPNTPPAIESVPKPPGGTGKFMQQMRP